MTNKSLLRLAGVLTTLTAFTCTASAQLITYVDATHGAAGNTARLDWDAQEEMWLSSEWNPTTNAENTGGWNNRTNVAFGTGGNVYENAGTDVIDDVHPLLTTVSGLALDTYDVYVYFWSDNTSGGTWTIRASLIGEGPGAGPDGGLWPVFNPSTNGVVQYYTGSDATVFSVSLGENNPFDADDVLIAGGNRRLYQVHLGQVTGTGYSVYIDDLPKTQTGGIGRTWYDGVGHAIPEPSTYALFFGLGILGFLGFRRLRR